MKHKILLLFFLLAGTVMAETADSLNCVSYLVVRSSVLDKDSAIYQAYEEFLDDSTANRLHLPVRYLDLDAYDSLIVLNEDATVLSQTLSKIKKTTGTVKSILGYSVSSDEEKHAMALIEPAAQMFFESDSIAWYLKNSLNLTDDAQQEQREVFVVVSLLKVYPNEQLINDINRTAKLASVFTGGLSFVTSAITKKALKATAGKGYSVIASNQFYKLNKETMTLENVGNDNNYGIVRSDDDKDTTLREATLKALTNAEEDLIDEYGKKLSNGKSLFGRLKEKVNLKTLLEK